MTTTEQILDEAINILSEPDSWMQKGYCNGTSSSFAVQLAESTAFCAMGAITEARRRLLGFTFLNFGDNPPAVAFRRALTQSGWPWSPITWNDKDGRQRSEVVAMFEKAKAYAAEYNL